MRWFKHMTGSARDEKLQTVISEFGLMGYGFYWRILEIIAEQMDKSDRTYCEYTLKSWAKLLGIFPKTFTKLLENFCEKNLFTSEYFQNSIRVDCPNLLRYRDEYAERKTKCRDIVPSVSGVCPDQDTETKADLQKEDIKDIAVSPETLSVSPDVSLICSHWNEQGVIIHRRFDERTKTQVRTRLKERTAEEITRAISNYAAVLKSPEHLWSYKWTLKEFLQRGLDKFLDEATPMENFKIRGKDERATVTAGGSKHERPREEWARPGTVEDF